MDIERRKQLGAYYTPDAVARSLVRWAVAAHTDRLLDPACGDGRFLAAHTNSVGVEGDPAAAAALKKRSPKSLIHAGDFFAWAIDTSERFECAAGNPPFIRYQRFTGAVRSTALALCAMQGARFSALSSSWAPFLVATASLLKPGGRMAFVVPAEIGHAPYAAPLLDYLLRCFTTVHIVAVRDKLFPDLSEDCWLLYCEGFGGKSRSFLFSALDRFCACEQPPRSARRVSLVEWQRSGRRLRPFVMPDRTFDAYRELAESAATCRLSDVARVGIGYVTGANDFFHLRPSIARFRGIDERFLAPAVRNGRDLVGTAINASTVEKWMRNDSPNFLLRLDARHDIPQPVKKYLDSDDGRAAREAYKCRNRTPWYVVPDVCVPDAFLSYMSGEAPALVANHAGCVATNSVHVVRVNGTLSVTELQRRWNDPLTRLSCEIEGHPLGGGLLKLEPREANRVVLHKTIGEPRGQDSELQEGIDIMRRWRHYG